MPEDAIARLTANEKECLRRRLLPQTAKEMAVDLGISPHAVEKRLKMARAKLGQSSSLAAARLLAEAEGYQRLVPGISDLSDSDDREEERSTAVPMTAARPTLHKGSIMLAFLFLVALAQDVPPAEVYASRMTTEKGDEIATRKVSMDEAAAFDAEGFRQKDRDRSGFLDAAEASTMEPRGSDRDPTLSPAPSDGSADRAAEAKWMAKLDNNRDGKVSEQEYVSYMMPWTLLSGVPAEWKPSARR